MNHAFEDNTSRRQALRREMLNRRQSWPAIERQAFSARLCRHLLALPLPAAGVVGFCWPIKGEPDVRPAVEAWRGRGWRTALPVVVADNAPLIFRPWQPGAALDQDRRGIPSPPDGDPLAPDVLLLPLVAFDAAGYRLGYGGGYFDRTLATLTPRPLTIGVGFEMNRAATIWPQPHDQAVDWIVTEAGAFRPAGAN